MALRSRVVIRRTRTAVRRQRTQSVRLPRLPRIVARAIALSMLLFGLALAVVLATGRMGRLLSAVGLAAYERLMPGKPVTALAEFECVPTNSLYSGVAPQCLIEGVANFKWILVTTGQGGITNLAGAPNMMTVGDLVLRWGRPDRTWSMGFRNGDQLYALEWGPTLKVVVRCSGYLTPRCAAASIEGGQ